MNSVKKQCGFVFYTHSQWILSLCIITILLGRGLGSDSCSSAASPVFQHGSSSFTVPATIHIVFDLPLSHLLVLASIGAPSESLTWLGTPPSDPKPSTPASCFNRTSLSAPWSELSPLGQDWMTREDFTDFTVFTGLLRVDTKVDQGVEVRGQRFYIAYSTDFSYQVRFPKVVAANLTRVLVVDSPNVAAAVISQDADVDLHIADTRATITVATQMQWPFRFAVSQLHPTAAVDGQFLPVLDGSHGRAASLQPGVNVTGFALGEDCADPTCGALDPSMPPSELCACRQDWIMSLDPLEQLDTCELDGLYSIRLSPECQPSLGDTGQSCPLDGSLPAEKALGFVLRVDSGNWCPQIVDLVDLAMTFSVWSTLNRTQTASSFAMGAVVYFAVQLTSTEVDVVAVRLHSVVIYYGSDPIQSWVVSDDGAIAVDPVWSPYAQFGFHHSGEALPTNHALVRVPADETWFSFQLLDSLFNVPADASRVFSIEVTVEAGFRGGSPVLLSLPVEHRSLRDYASFVVSGSAFVRSDSRAEFGVGTIVTQTSARSWLNRPAWQLLAVLVCVGLVGTASAYASQVLVTKPGAYWGKMRAFISRAPPKDEPL